MGNKIYWYTSSPLRPIQTDSDGEMIFEQALQIVKVAKLNPDKIAARYHPNVLLRAIQIVKKHLPDGKIMRPKSRRTVSKYGQAKHRRKPKKIIARPIHREAPIKKPAPAVPRFPHLRKLYYFLQDLLHKNPFMRRDEALALANAEGFTNLFGEKWQTLGFSEFCRQYKIGFQKSKPKKKRPYKYKTPRKPYGPKEAKKALIDFIRQTNAGRAVSEYMKMADLVRLIWDKGPLNKLGKPYNRATIYITAQKFCGYPVKKKSKTP